MDKSVEYWTRHKEIYTRLFDALDDDARAAIQHDPFGGDATELNQKTLETLNKEYASNQM